jgi:hypothetical protein
MEITKEKAAEYMMATAHMKLENYLNGLPNFGSEKANEKFRRELPLGFASMAVHASTYEWQRVVKELRGGQYFINVKRNLNGEIILIPSKALAALL